MDKAASLGLSLSEETLTESSLYDIAVTHQSGDIVITLATKPAEKKHGADWEWWFVRGDMGLGFRVQAKRLFADGRYRSLLKSSVNPYEQLDTLVSSAATADMEPLYCFYNFHARFEAGGPNLCKHAYRGPSFRGCTLAFPDHVKAVQSDTLAQLQPVMHPWHELVCESDGIDLVQAAGKFVEKSKGSRKGPARASAASVATD